jgi:hypothetical protein
MINTTCDFDSQLRTSIDCHAAGPSFHPNAPIHGQDLGFDQVITSIRSTYTTNIYTKRLQYMLISHTLRNPLELTSYGGQPLKGHGRRFGRGSSVNLGINGSQSVRLQVDLTKKGMRGHSSCRSSASAPKQSVFGNFLHVPRWLVLHQLAACWLGQVTFINPIRSTSMLSTLLFLILDQDRRIDITLPRVQHILNSVNCLEGFEKS